MIETLSPTETLVIPSRFNGPRESGNGGYSSGAVAALIDGPAAVSLKSPVPMDRPLAVERGTDGDVAVRHGHALVATARLVPELDLAVPPPVTVDEAREAARHYHGSGFDLLSRCYVCGPDREDSFGVHAAPVEGRNVVATPWTPVAWAAHDEAHVRPEHLWGVLDCPTYFGSYLRDPYTLSMLARMQARIDAPVVVGRDHVVMAWPIATDGRKRHAGAAILSADGEVLAVARALLIELKR